MDLLRSNITLRADIEFTSDCNLRCIYCASLKQAYERQTLDLSLLDGIIDSLKRRKAITVGVSGHGETTIVPSWDLHCRKMLDQGLELYISSNLARELSEEELKTLSRFRIVQMSCDTDDLKLFKELRRGGDFRTLVYNMGKIRSCAIRKGRRPPEFWWHCVLSDKTVQTLEGYVSFGLTQGVKLFNFINLVKHVDVEAMRSVRHITELPREQLEEIPVRFAKVFRTIRKNGATYICDSLLESVRERLSHDQSVSKYGQSLPAHATRQDPGMTRNCIDPWTYVKVAASGSIVPCCRGDRSVGNLRGGNLDDILNASQMRAFREQLLTGNLEEVCQTCNIRSWTSIKALRLKVALFSSLGRFLPLADKLGVLLPLLYRIRRTT